MDEVQTASISAFPLLTARIYQQNLASPLPFAFKIVNLNNYILCCIIIEQS